MQKQIFIMIISKPKYSFSFLINLKSTSTETKLAKLNPILTQLSINNSSKLDDFLTELISSNLNFLNYYFLQKNNNIATPSIKLDLILWKNSNLFSFINLKIFLLDYIFKINYSQLKNFKYFYNSKFNFYKNKKTFFTKTKKLSLLFLLLLSSLEVSSEIPLSYDVLKLKNSQKTLFSTLKTYRYRTRDLGRTINFKQKIKKKQFSEY